MVLEEIKKKKLEELQGRILAEQNDTLQKEYEEQMKLQQQISLLEETAKQFLSKEAIERYGRIKIAHPAIAIKAIALISQAAQLGHLTEKLSEEEFKQLLKHLQEGKKEFRFRR